MNAPIVIVGAGLAGSKAAETLRAEGDDSDVVLIGAEPERPYERPALSKDYLAGRVDRESVYVHEASWYESHAVDLRVATTVVAVDRTVSEVQLSTGERLAYHRLLLATGSQPRTLDVPGSTASGIRTLRTLPDSDQLREAIATASDVVVVGAGWIGLEVAAAARAAGCTVTIVETADLPLVRILGPQIAAVFAALHRDNGVDLRLRTGVSRFTTAAGHVTGVELSDGTSVAAQLVVVGVGISPRVELAAGAGLDVADGVTTDASLQTSDPRIYAAGDVAAAFHPLLGRRIRVEHWANALHQPQAAARAMLGQDVSYDRLPYFYTDQFDLGMEYTGYAMPGEYDDVIIRGDLDAREFVAFWTSGGRVAAGMNVNVWDVTDQIKALIRSRAVVDPVALADPGTPLESLS
ncbi:MAG: NAD(P)/FAD-dependent oxidoreductase [Actinomycetota bacterium]|nr:MAG: NAD(P)/FAD-dependent oxidoreductase [Actinomycetota bacterium]